MAAETQQREHSAEARGASDVRRESEGDAPKVERTELRPAHPRYGSAPTHTLAGDEVIEELGTRGVPKRAMHEPLRAPDDEVLERRHANEEAGVASFRPDPELGDAAAELAEELGRSFVESATAVADVSELVVPEETAEEEVGGPFVVTGIESELGREAAVNLRDVDEKSRRRPGK